MPPPVLKLGLAREYRKLQPGVKPLYSATCVWQFVNLNFSTLVAHALTPVLPPPLIHRCVDRFWLADYGGTDFSTFNQEMEKEQSEAA
jgi:hypothetical protein